MTEVTLPHSLSTIGEYAFAECTHLAEVYYKGNAEEWEAISKGENNDPLINAHINYITTEED